MIKFPIYNKADIDTILNKIVNDKIYQNEISCDNMIDESIITPLINNIQTEMKYKNLYPGYNDSFSIRDLFITILSFSLGIRLLFIPVDIVKMMGIIILILSGCMMILYNGYCVYNLNIGKYNTTNYNIFRNSKIKLSRHFIKNDNTEIANVIIKYYDDKKFYEGTMFGNFFERNFLLSKW